MPLATFFNVNMPYGLKRISEGWVTFNREYQPLSWGSTYPRIIDEVTMPHEIIVEYKGLTEKLILLIVDDEDSIHRDESGNIVRFFLYNDGSNPGNMSGKRKDICYVKYFNKLQKLCQLKRK